MMIYKIITLVLIMIGLSGCFNGQPKPEIKTVIVTKIKEVKVPVPCKVPKVSCDFNGPGFTPINKLLECVVKQKRALESVADNNISK